MITHIKSNLRNNFRSLNFIFKDVSLFYPLVILYLFFIDFISGSSDFKRVFFVSTLTILSYILTYAKVSTHSAKILYLVCLSFGVYFLLQSPIFPSTYFRYEVLYFSFKLCFIIVAIFFIIKRYYTLLALTTLTLFYSDIVYIIEPLTQYVTKSSTEYFSIWESVVALYACIISLQLYSWIFKAKFNWQKIQQTLIILFLVGHLANYFGAFHAKFFLDGGSFSWLENETFSSLRRADLWGLNVLGFLLDYEFVLSLEPFLNHLTFWSQLASTLVIIVPILIAPLTIFYDFFHLGVGLIAGPWFYKWIFVNILILAYCPYIIKILKTYSWTKILITQLLVPTIFFIGSIVPLGWYEYRQGALIYAYGIDQDGDAERLHHQFFGPHSFTILQKRSHYAFPSGLPLQMGGQSYSELELSKDCRRSEIKSPSLKYHRSLLESVTQRVLEDRSTFSKVMMHLQPYHVVIPSNELVNYSFKKDYNAIRFDLMHVCLNDKYEIINHTVRDTLTINKILNNL